MGLEVDKVAFTRHESKCSTTLSVNGLDDRGESVAVLSFFLEATVINDDSFLTTKLVYSDHDRFMVSPKRAFTNPAVYPRILRGCIREVLGDLATARSQSLLLYSYLEATYNAFEYSDMQD